MSDDDYKQEFDRLYTEFMTKYGAAKGDDITLENFAKDSSTDRLMAELYAIKQYADPTKAADFKKISDRLAWKVGAPPQAINEFSQHKDIDGWEITDGGNTMILSLQSAGGKCSAALREKIKKDFEKMAPGYKWKDTFFDDPGNPTRIKIPRPESAALQNYLNGRFLEKNKGAGKTPLDPKLIEKLGTGPLFKVWDDYQKKILKAAESPEAMLTGFCELTFMLPFNYLNEVVSGLNSYLKEKALSEPKADPRRTPRTPGGPTPPPGGPTPPPGGPTPPGGDPSIPGTPTVEDLHNITTRTLIIERFNKDLLAELGRMKDPKSQALHQMIHEWQDESKDPAAKTNPAKAGELMSRGQVLAAQLEEMTPFVIQYARDHRHLSLDASLDATFPPDSVDRKKIEQQIENIKNGLTPLGKKIEGQTAPDFEQLYGALTGEKWADKQGDFNLVYNTLSGEHQNNALVNAVKRIMSDDKLSDAERQAQFKELMAQSIWTPNDIAAATKLTTELNARHKLNENLPEKEIKPYGQDAPGREMDVGNVANLNKDKIDTALNDYLTKGISLPASVKTVETTRRRGSTTTNVRLTEIIDEKSGSITLRVDETGKSSYYLTYNEAQDVLVVQQGTASGRKEHASTLTECKNSCMNLSQHYTLIQGGKDPFQNKSNLRHTFTSLGMARNKGLER